MTTPNDPHEPTRATPKGPPQASGAGRSPVRPAALEQPLPTIEDTPKSRPPAASRTRGAVGDAAHPCPSCGYDLRGLPAGGYCPECATKIPRRVRVNPSSPEAKVLRFELASAWRGLAVVALAPIVLLSPLPYLLPFGMPIAVAAGFAPVFRLVSLRRFDALPDALAPVASPPVGSLRALQIAELGFVAIVAVFAVGGTLGAIPATLVSFYYGTVFVWWLVAMTTVSVQLRGGHAIAAHLVDPAILPSVERPVRCAMLARIAGATGVLVGLGTATVFAGTSAAGPLGTLGLLLVIAAAGLGFYACLLAYGHAPIVAECMIESDLLRERGSSEGDGADAEPLDPSTPPPASPGSWEDEERVPLA